MSKTVKLFKTNTHPCSYLPGRHAETLFVDPEQAVSPEIFGHLSEIGFRRSGRFIYQPNCKGCQACISVRIPVREFEPTRSQKRVKRRNQDLRVVVSEPELNPTTYELYERYIHARHQDGDMYPPSEEHFQEFIMDSPVDSMFYNYYLDNKLIAVCLADRLTHGLSAVYSFFDPDLNSRSLGNHMILNLIDQAISKELDYVYLGYWVKDCQKMNYKSQYRPLEMLVKAEWIRLI